MRSVYVHAPFCARRCLYCDFAVHVSRHGDLPGWLAALEGELALVEENGPISLAPSLKTLFVGGGTPSILGPEAMVGLGKVLGVDRLTEPDLEWTSEANPESFSVDVAKAWRRAGVNRISLGVQSFQEGPLAWMGRLHGAEGGRVAVSRARAAGFRNLSVDLIFGLPASVSRDWTYDLDCALALEVPHLSLYGLTVESRTPFGQAVEGGRELPVDDARYGDEFLLACERLSSAGYIQYELSNFSLAGFESRHNQACWALLPYLGLGNAAHSFRHPLRKWNLRDWAEYQTAVLEGRDPTEGWEKLDGESMRLEAIWLGLRTRWGVALQSLSSRGLALVEEWEGQGWAELLQGAIRMTPTGWLLLDRLAVDLASVEEEACPSP